MDEYAHLHVHSHFSLLDGMSTPEEICQITNEHGQKSVALTDHGTMSGTLAFQKAGKKYGINTIMGAEAYYVPKIEEDDGDKTRERFHLIVLAKNQTGLEKMFKVQQHAWVDNFYYKNRMDFSDLEYMAGDIVVLSGCMGGQLCRLIENDKADEAMLLAMQFRDLLGEDYYIEIQPWNSIPLNLALMKIAESLNIKTVGTLDCHYPTEKDAGVEEFLLMMGQMPGMKPAHARYAKEMAEKALTEPKLIDKMNTMYPDRFLKFHDIKPYIMSPKEVAEEFSALKDYVSELMSNTLEIADKCNSEIATGLSLLPKFHKKYDSSEYLYEIAHLGLEERGFGKNQVYLDRLNHELDVVSRLGFSDYFLMTWDICNYADTHDIARGPGRGSVVGSLLAFALKITKPDPIKYKLLFERFINEDRINFPDIDLDFANKHRHLIKKYIAERWGQDNVASISTYTEFKPKGTIKSALSVLQVPFTEANAVSPLFETVEEFEALSKSDNPDVAKLIKKYPAVPKIARRLDGRVKGNGVHASAMVVSKQPLWMNMPIETRGDEDNPGSERLKVIAFDGNEAEDLGLWKFDILGLDAVSVIDDCIRRIKSDYSIDVTDISEGMDDITVIKRFNTDSLSGIFQAEGSGYKQLIEDMGIDDINDLIASTALVRPGAMTTQGKPYIARKNGLEDVDYPHECLAGVLEETYGTVVYQEQLMLLSMELCGFTMNEADTLRKIIGKKRDAKEFQPFYEKFMSGAQEKVSAKVAQQLWENLERTAEYMFNKSHSVGYSFLAYQTMWLKHYYPTEFIWSCLTNETKSAAMASFLIEGTRLGIDVLLPDINLSDESFTLERGAVRFGLGDINKAGPAAVEEIIAKRPYTSYEEFVNKVRPTAVKKPLIENLEKIGAFGSVGYDAGYDTKKYFLEVLNCTMYVNDDTRFDDVLHNLADFPDSGTVGVVRGIVKAVKRTTTYFRIEMEDESGTRSFFADDIQAGIRKGDFILALVGNKGLIAFQNPYEDGPLTDFILNPNRLPYKGVCETLRKGHVLGLVLSCKTFKTKKQGLTMGNPLIYDLVKKEFKKYTMFPSTYEQYSGQLSPFQYVVVRPQSDPTMIDGLISIDKYAIMKSLEPEEWFSNQLTPGV